MINCKLKKGYAKELKSNRGKRVYGIDCPGFTCLSTVVDISYKHNLILDLFSIARSTTLLFSKK
jgi:hypothetical protein